MRAQHIVTAVLLAALTLPAAASDWQHYGGDAGGTRYSSLEQITPDNVSELDVAWQIRTGEMEKRGPVAVAGQFQATPILTPEAAGQSLVLCTPWNKVIALDPVTGAERWSHDPKAKGFPLYNCRGVTYWEDTRADENSVCRHRIVSGTFDLRIMALDARTGELCPDFGEAGYVQTRALIKDESPAFDSPGDIKYFSPPVVVDDVLVIGSATFTKNKSVSGPSGAIRGFDARTGAHLWSFDPVPRDPEDPEHGNWTAEALATTGAASAWAPLSTDPDRGLVFVPTSSPTPDFFGGLRPGDNRYANSTVALQAKTGEVVWHFQNIHHDVWDWDTPAQPIAADIRKDGQTVPSVIQLTKQGLTFTFDRDSGSPLFAVEEKPVPTNTEFDDELSPTQPFPVAPPPLAANGITPDDAWGLTPWDRGKCRELIEAHRYGPVFTPHSTRGSITITSINNWAGGAYDRRNNLLITNVSNVFWLTNVIPAAEYEPDKSGNFGPPAPVIDGWGYAVTRQPLLSPWGIPCTAPPWGKLVAVDMDSGTIRWETALGSLEKLLPFDLPFDLELPIPWGTPGAAGGPIVTASGLVFIGATSDEKFRAFDVTSGTELWKASLPTAANATPMTYAIDGKQYVVVVSGGHVWQYPTVSDYVTAFALPE